MDTVFRRIKSLGGNKAMNPGHRMTMNLFFSMVLLLWFFVGIFIYYQYTREKEFRINLLTTKLLNLNDEIVAEFTGSGGKLSLEKVVANDDIPQLKNLRVTIMDMEGRVLWDNMESDISLLGNHRNRPEVQQALEHGRGYTVRRSSETMNEDFFYVASCFPSKGHLVRAALPYDVDLLKVLQADMGFLWFSLCVTLVLMLVFYRQVRVLGSMINDLQERENSKLKRQLSQNMSHELKTPVSSIQGYVETILRNPKMDERQRIQFLNRCHVQTQRLTSLLRDINTLNRIDEAPEQLEKVRIDLTPLINGIVSDVQLSLSERKMGVSVDIPDEMPVKGNEGLLYSIFRNLLDNSIAYAGDGTAIRLEAHYEEKGMWHFCYSDNGVGISEEHMPSIFNRFYRVDKGRSRRIGGTGLGLAIVKNAVLFHGGTISAQHAPDGGLMFDFTLEKGGR